MTRWELLIKVHYTKKQIVCNFDKIESTVMKPELDSKFSANFIHGIHFVRKLLLFNCQYPV